MSSEKTDVLKQCLNCTWLLLIDWICLFLGNSIILHLLIRYVHVLWQPSFIGYLHMLLSVSLICFLFTCLFLYLLSTQDSACVFYLLSTHVSASNCYLLSTQESASICYLHKSLPLVKLYIVWWMQKNLKNWDNLSAFFTHYDEFEFCVPVVILYVSGISKSFLSFNSSSFSPSYWLPTWRTCFR